MSDVICKALYVGMRSVLYFHEFTSSGHAQTHTTYRNSSIEDAKSDNPHMGGRCLCEKVCKCCLNIMGQSIK